jgi:hypothetical protein
MMRSVKILFSLALISGIFTGAYGQAAMPASATGHITAEIIPIFSATETSQMNFGKFAPGPEGGEIILSPQGTVSTLGTVYKGTGFHNAASFYISGDADASFSISLPAGPVLLTNMSNARTMKVERWVSNPSAGIGTGKLQNGFQVVYVGATLKVGTLNDNPVGIYTGSYTITFDFN